MDFLINAFGEKFLAAKIREGTRRFFYFNSCHEETRRDTKKKDGFTEGVNNSPKGTYPHFSNLPTFHPSRFSLSARRAYEFKAGIRGKHYKAFRRGHTVKVHKDDGTTTVRYFKLEDGAV